MLNLTIKTLNQTKNKTMKKAIIIALLLCISTLSFSQQFDGINISGDFTSALNKFKAKGYVVVKGEGNRYILSGSINSLPVEILILGTPKTRQFAKVTVWLPKKTNWESLKSNYQDWLELLTTKYGKPSSSYNFFKTPYYEGDGYELTAVSSEKCVYAAYWIDILQNMTLAISISEYQQVEIVYENDSIMELYKKEKDIINGNSF